MADTFVSKIKAIVARFSKKPASKVPLHPVEHSWRQLMPKGRGMQAYRMAIWNSHVLLVMVVVSVLLNLVLGILLLLAYPLKRVEPMLIQAKGKDDVYITVTPLNPSVKGYDVLLESMVRKYVSLRESIDLVMDAERWNEIRMLSKPEVWNPFYKDLVSNKETYQKRYKDQVARQVNIRNISRLDHDLYQVEWEATDKHLHEPLQTSVWVSILRFSVEPKTVKLEDRHQNPLGFLVTAYSVTRKDDK